MPQRFRGLRFYSLLPTMILLLALVSGCAGSRASKPAVEVNVWAASSLKDALIKLAPAFEKANHAKLVFNFASSGDLQIQIEQGARADIFLSAGKKQMDSLAQKNLIYPGSRKPFIGNTLVVAVPSASNIKITKVEDITAIADIHHIAIGNPSDVPAGKYAQQSLEKAKIYKAVKSKLVLAKDVRQVLAYLETGDADLGFVYASDLRAAKNVRKEFTIPDTYHDGIVYTLGVVRAGKQPKPAAKLTDYLRGDKALKVFKYYGFQWGNKPNPGY